MWLKRNVKDYLTAGRFPNGYMDFCAVSASCTHRFLLYSLVLCEEWCKLISNGEKTASMAANPALLARSVRFSRVRCLPPGSLPVQQRALLVGSLRSVTSATASAAEVARAAATPADKVRSDCEVKLSREEVASNAHFFAHFRKDRHMGGAYTGLQQLEHTVGEEQQREHTGLNAINSDNNSEGHICTQNCSPDGGSIRSDNISSHSISSEKCSTTRATFQVLHHLQLRQRMQAETIPFRVHRTASDNLPVSLSWSHSRSQVRTVIRKVAGDRQSLMRELAFLCDAPVWEGEGCICISGNKKSIVKQWLQDIGF